MEITYLKISGWDGAIRSMYMSLGNYTPELENTLKLCHAIEEYKDSMKMAPNAIPSDSVSALVSFDDIMSWYEQEKQKVIKFGSKHITLLRYLDITMTVKGLHRGAQDDFDAHAERFDNRIVRMSTRTKNNENIIELSDYYKGKVLSFVDINDAITLPATIEKSGEIYRKTSLGYVNEKYLDDKDVRRGLIPLAIASTFTVKVQITEYCHVVRERNSGGNAHPELKQLIEMSIPLIEEQVPEFNREFFMTQCIQ